MKRRVRGALSGLSLVLAGLCAAVAAPARAAAPEPRYVYFNRPGAGLDEHDRAVWGCAEEAAKVVSLHRAFKEAPPGLFGTLMGATLTDGVDDRAAAGLIESCMVVRGWRAVGLDPLEGEAIAAGAPAEAAARLAPWVGAAEPHGEVLRQWRNDAAKGWLEPSSARSMRGLVSFAAASAAGLPPFASAPRAPPVYLILDKRWPPDPVDPRKLGPLAPDAALIIVEVIGQAAHGNAAIGLVRMGPDRDTPPSLADHKPDRFDAGGPLFYLSASGTFIAFVAPAGRWRIGTLGYSPTHSLCLGSPAFEVEAGEVVFAGAFDFRDQALGPDLAMGPVRDRLKGLPFAAKVRPAAYTNGTLGRCDGDDFYALEIPGAPFEPGYAAGSQAQR